MKPIKDPEELRIVANFTRRPYKRIRGGTYGHYWTLAKSNYSGIGQHDGICQGYGFRIILIEDKDE